MKPGVYILKKFPPLLENKMIFEVQEGKKIRHQKALG